MNMRILKWVFLVLVVIFVVAIYAVFVSFSEHREYSSDSLLSYLLTPTELSVLSGRCEDRPVFVYSSADGPRPTVVTLSCTIAKHDFEQQMNSSGFQHINSDLYKKKNVQIQVTTSPDEKKVISVAFVGFN
jgi:hypothetical protein